MLGRHGWGAGLFAGRRGGIYVYIKKLTISKLLGYINYMEETISYYARNKESRKNYQREYYKTNRDKIKTKRQYDETNNPSLKEARKEYNSNYYKNNKARILARRRELYKAKKTP